MFSDFVARRTTECEKYLQGTKKKKSCGADLTKSKKSKKNIASDA